MGPSSESNAVNDELHVRAFRDSNADGIGDFCGLVEKLDYLQDLGVTALWLLPFYPSPLRDDSYDIADYTSVNPIYGNLDDFKTFLREAHRRGLGVITELVLARFGGMEAVELLGHPITSSGLGRAHVGFSGADAALGALQSAHPTNRPYPCPPLHVIYCTCVDCRGPEIAAVAISPDSGGPYTGATCTRQDCDRKLAR